MLKSIYFAGAIVALAVACPLSHAQPATQPAVAATAEPAGDEFSPPNIPPLKSQPLVDKPAAMTPQRQAVRKIFAAAEKVLTDHIATITKDKPLGQSGELRHLHHLGHAAARHGEARVAQRLAMADTVSYERLVLLVAAVEAYHATGESAFASKLAVATNNLFVTARPQYSVTGVVPNLDGALAKLIAGRARVGDAGTAVAMVRKWPSDIQFQLVGAIAEGSMAGGQIDNAKAMYRFVSYGPTLPEVPPEQWPDANAPNQFGEQAAFWRKDYELAEFLLGNRPTLIPLVEEMDPKLVPAICVQRSQRFARDNNLPAARAELAKAVQAVDAGPALKDPFQKMSNGYCFAALSDIAKFAVMVEDPQLSRDATARAAKLVTDLNLPDKAHFWSGVAMLQALSGDEAGLKQTLAGLKPSPGSQTDPVAVEKHAREMAALDIRQFGFMAAERKRGTGKPASQPATRPSVMPEAVDAQIAAILKTGTPEQKVEALVDLANRVQPGK